MLLINFGNGTMNKDKELSFRDYEEFADALKNKDINFATIITNSIQVINSSLSLKVLLNFILYYIYIFYFLNKSVNHSNWSGNIHIADINIPIIIIGIPIMGDAIHNIKPIINNEPPEIINQLFC